MSNIISQEEIEALFNSASQDNGEAESSSGLTEMETDALGEIGNITMGTAATTLSQVLNRRVMITTPKVNIINIKDLANKLQIPFVIVEVKYTNGLQGNNILILKEDDVRLITDLMMGGEGVNNGEELSELHLSAISEAMNQMMGSAATSMSDMLGRAIDISPPKSIVAKLDDSEVLDVFKDSGNVISVSFALEIDQLTSSEIMQMMPLEFGRELVQALMNPSSEPQSEPQPQAAAAPAAPAPQPRPQAAPQPQAFQGAQEPAFDFGAAAASPYAAYAQSAPARERPVDAKPVQLMSFDEDLPLGDARDDGINLIIDVPMQVTIELGKCKKTVKEILEFNTGTILILEKLAGEPVEVVVNDKLIAKGEVIQIDDNYGVRITELMNTGRSRAI